jgi:hypothetical protein
MKSYFRYEKEVMSWEVLLKNAEKKCESTNTASFWPRHDIREGKVDNDTVNLFWKKIKAPEVFSPVLFLWFAGSTL